MSKLLYIILITLTIPSVAQQDNVFFKHITSDDGLPSNYVEQIYQTKDGFMWFGTSDGLSRYDGLSFLNFRNNPTDTTGLIDNEIKCLTEDNYNRLWVGTQKGLTYLDLKTYKFKWFTVEYPDNIGNCWVSSFLKFNNEVLFIGTYGHGVYVFDLNKNKIVDNYNVNQGHKSLINCDIRFLCLDKFSNIWIATNSGLDVIDFKTKKITHLLKGQVIFNLCVDNKGDILATALNSADLYTIAPTSYKVTEIESLDSKYKEKAKIFFFDNIGNKWLSVGGDGLYLYNSQKQLIHHFVNNSHVPEGLSSNNTLTIFEDKNGNLWFGTFDAGVSLLNKYRKPFIQVKNDNRKDGLLNNQIRSIFQDRDGDIWIGTKSGGMLSKFNRKDYTFINYKNIPNDPTSLNDDIVRTITDGNPGDLWVGTLIGGINILNKKTGKFSFLKYSVNTTNQIASNNIAVLYNDNQGKIWIGHGEQGLDIYNLKTGNILHFKNSENSNGLTDNRVRAIFRDSQGNMWIGTMHGLNLLDKEYHIVKKFINNWKDSSSISGNNITCVYEDKEKNIWIGTTNGFNLWNSKTQNFKVFNNAKGFPGNSVRGILDDSEGNLWIGADNGLIKYDIKKGDFIKYGKADGLNSNELTQYAYCKSWNGEMYFGTGNGFVVFDPDKITNNIIIPNVVVTKFKLFNQDVNIHSPGSPLDIDITRTKEMVLTYKQSVFTLEFTALNYTSPENNQFAYRLDGIDKDWNYIGNRHEVTFTNLPAGNYVFRVKASNNDGLWNEQGTSIKITILPPPWKTWWAYMLYTVLLLLIFLKYREITIKKVKAEKERDLDQMKLKLFMNISHEFRTPLTLMINPIKKITETDDINEIKTSASIVQKSTWKLLNLVNQLLDFRKMDKGGMPLRAREVDIISYTRQLSQLFDDIAQSKGMKYEFNTTLKELKVWLDADKYEKVMNNLLSNAFKFTDDGGKVTIQIDRIKIRQGFEFGKVLNPNKGVDYVEIRVVDTGIGISKEDLNNIFERFYQVDHTKVGTGIGLNYVKSLVELHGGKVLVESEQGEGSCFIIRLPLGDAHLKAEQKDFINKGFADAFDKEAIESLKYDIESTDIYPITEIDVENNNANSGNKLVLLIEDNKVLRKQIYDELKNIYIIKEASNGEDGLQKARKFLPDLIVSDIMMPKMDGIELCKQLKSDINTCHIPIILLTAKSSIENKIEGFETGADDYIPKPFSMKLLEVRILNLIQSRTMLKEKFLSSKVIAPAKEYTTNNLDEAFLEKLTNIVLENIEDSDFSLSELRTKIGMGQTNLFVKLQSLTGQNPSNFVRTIRLQYAASLLTQGNISIKDVCYKCGFNSHAYFTKTFKELFGLSPSEFVDNNVKGHKESKS